jgi:hypothetical protein
MRRTSTVRYAAEFKIIHTSDTMIYVENLLKVRSKNHRNNRSTPSFYYNQQRIQGVFSRASR